MTNFEMFFRQSESDASRLVRKFSRGPHELKVSGVIALVMDAFQTTSEVAS